MPERLDVLEREFKRLTGWRYWLPNIATSLLVSVIVAGTTLWLVGDSNDEAIKEARGAVASGQRQGCGPNNVRQALNRKIVGDGIPKLRATYEAANPILWCERTYTSTNNGQRRYMLPVASERCFVGLSYAGYFKDRKPFTDPARLARACRG
jgi:hypothetical protein